MRKDYRAILLGIMVVFGLGAIVRADAQYAVVSIKATEVDSLYPHWYSQTEGRYFPGLLGVGSDTVTIGGIGDESRVSWRGVSFPGNPRGMVFLYAGPNNTNIDFYENALDGPASIFFWSCAVSSNSPGWRPVVWSDTCWIDYSAFTNGIPDLSGTHELFLAFSCGAAGCLDLAQVDFLFAPNVLSTIQAWRAGRQLVNQLKPRLVLYGHEGIRGDVYSRRSIRIYDIRGRVMAKPPVGGSGLVVVKGMEK
jgi:hypothetical protein